MKVAVDCPGCGASVEVDPGGRSAELFCGRCDYPLFWVRPPRSAEEVDVSDSVLRRRPGAGGIAQRATLPCPACAELNAVLAVLCVRCGAEMHPAEPEPEPEPVVEIVAPPPLPEEPDPWWRFWIIPAAVVLAVVLLGLLLAWIL